jgi:hypothetical protein
MPWSTRSACSATGILYQATCRSPVLYGHNAGCRCAPMRCADSASLRPLSLKAHSPMKTPNPSPVSRLFWPAKFFRAIRTYPKLCLAVPHPLSCQKVPCHGSSPTYPILYSRKTLKTSEGSRSADEARSSATRGSSGVPPASWDQCLGPR